MGVIHRPNIAVGRGNSQTIRCKTLSDLQTIPILLQGFGEFALGFIHLPNIVVGLGNSQTTRCETLSDLQTIPILLQGFGASALN